MLLNKFKYLIICKILFLIIWIVLCFYNIILSKNDSISNNFEKKIVFILDVSHSMNVDDIKTNYSLNISRLNASKILISKYVENYPDFKFWLIVFSRNSNYFIPATNDKNNFLNYLNNINTNIIPAGWSNIMGWINDFIEYTTDNAIGILISDFWEQNDYMNQKKQWDELSKKLNKNNQKLLLYWFWTNNWWIAKYPDDIAIKSNWKTVVSKINTEYWLYLANKFNAEYNKLDYIDKNFSIKKDLLNKTNNTINKKMKIIEIITNLSLIIWL